MGARVHSAAQTPQLPPEADSAELVSASSRMFGVRGYRRCAADASRTGRNSDVGR